MKMFSGGPLEHRVMQKAGCVEYLTTEWERVNRNIYQWDISFRFDKSMPQYGGEAKTTQQRCNLPNRDGWVIDKVMTLHGVLLGDHFSGSGVVGDCLVEEHYAPKEGYKECLVELRHPVEGDLCGSREGAYIKKRCKQTAIQGKEQIDPFLESSRLRENSILDTIVAGPVFSKIASLRRC